MWDTFQACDKRESPVPLMGAIFSTTGDDGPDDPGARAVDAVEGTLASIGEANFDASRVLCPALSPGRL
jgi:hypothetical protein